ERRERFHEFELEVRLPIRDWASAHDLAETREVIVLRQHERTLRRELAFAQERSPLERGRVPLGGLQREAVVVDAFPVPILSRGPLPLRELALDSGDRLRRSSTVVDAHETEQAFDVAFVRVANAGVRIAVLQVVIAVR